MPVVQPLSLSSQSHLPSPTSRCGAWVFKSTLLLSQLPFLTSHLTPTGIYLEGNRGRLRLEEGEEPLPSAPGTSSSCGYHSFSSASSPGHGDSCPQQQPNLRCSFSNTGRFVFSVASVRYQSFMASSSELLHFNNFKPFFCCSLILRGRACFFSLPSPQCLRVLFLPRSHPANSSLYRILFVKISVAGSPGWWEHSL